jgi:hypothetical protein
MLYTCDVHTEQVKVDECFDGDVRAAWKGMRALHRQVVQHGLGEVRKKEEEGYIPINLYININLY